MREKGGVDEGEEGLIMRQTRHLTTGDDVHTINFAN